MKKYTLLTVLLFGLGIQKSNAQCTVVGHASLPANYLGYGAAGNDLPFSATGTYQMYLLQTGSLNIVGGAKGYEIGGVCFYGAMAVHTMLIWGLALGHLQLRALVVAMYFVAFRQESP